MGGTIAIIVRRKGKIIPMLRWTNPIPGFIHDMDFIEDKDSHFEYFMKSYREMEEDWKQHKKEYLDNEKKHRAEKKAKYFNNDPFKFPMTAAYAPYPWMKAPSDYGIIVIDYDSKTILSSQGYTAVGMLMMSELSFYANDIKEQNKNRESIFKLLFNDLKIKELAEDSKSQFERIPKLFDAGRFKYIAGLDRKSAKPVAVLMPKTTLKEIAELYKSQYSAKNRSKVKIVWSEVILDMSPWKIEDYGEQGKDIMKVQERMKELGFSFTEKEKKAWTKFIKNR